VNHAMLNMLPSHITTVRQGAIIWTRFAPSSWGSKDYMTIGNAKRYVRMDLACKGGPKSQVRTTRSLEAAGLL